MSTTAEPLRAPRLASYLLTFAFSIAGFAIGVWGLVKSYDEKDDFKRRAPAGTTVHINTDDVLDAGYVLTAGCGLTAVVSLLALAHTLLAGRRGRFHGLETGALAFCLVWLFATLVPVTDFVATRQAKVTAYIGSLKLPQSVIDQTEKALGVTGVYKKKDYLRLLCIIPWIAFLFTAISVALAYLAWRRVRAGGASVRHSTAPMLEKSAEEQRERV